MVDTVNTQVVFNGNRRYTVHLTNESDGTGESAVTKVDISTLTDGAGVAATYFTVDLIEYSVWGFDYATLEWDATVNDEIAVLFGQGVIDWVAFGGKTDPQSSGSTGDLVLTTNGGASGSGYDITLHIRPKA
jgi:hypothetical protein